ncbi:MAG: acyl-ACP thioesterase domain-containing protein [Gaiella sp.]
MDTTLPRPSSGRTFRDERRVRLADMDASGRVRLDAVARLLQDVAIDDVQETGWGAPEHLWFVRRMRVDVLAPLLDDRRLELVTWCSGVASIAAGRRWSLTGDRGGRVEVDSVWIHLDAHARPARVGAFGGYGVAAGGRVVSTRLELPDPPAAAARRAWPLRSTDLDLHGHVNNATHWQAVEDVLLASGEVDARRALRAELDYREPLDAGDELSVARFDDGDHRCLALCVGDATRAVARVASLGEGQITAPPPPRHAR